MQRKLEAWRGMSDELFAKFGLGPLVEQRVGIQTLKTRAALGTLGK